MTRQQYSVSLDPSVVEWADEHYRELGFQSRSALLNHALTVYAPESEL